MGHLCGTGKCFLKRSSLGNFFFEEGIFSFFPPISFSFLPRLPPHTQALDRTRFEQNEEKKLSTFFSTLDEFFTSASALAGRYPSAAGLKDQVIPA